MTQENSDPESILELARDDPDAIEVDEVVKSFDNDQGAARVYALRTVSFVAMDSPERVVDHAERIREMLDDGFPVAESAAALVCLPLASEYPDSMRPAIPRLVRMLDEEPPQKGYRAAQTLVPLLEEYPASFVPAADDLVDVIADPPEVETPSPEELAELPEDERQQRVEMLRSRRDQIQQDMSRTYGIQEAAAHALVEVASEGPDALRDRVDDIRTGLAAEPSAVRAATADALATLAGADPDAIEPAIDDLVAIIGSDTSGVQAYAIRALGQAVATEAVAPLRELAADDGTDEDLADLAAETADFLADQQ